MSFPLHIAPVPHPEEEEVWQNMYQALGDVCLALEPFDGGDPRRTAVYHVLAAAVLALHLADLSNDNDMRAVAQTLQELVGQLPCKAH